MVNRIAENFHPEKIILFGSHAYGKSTTESDVDLLVIMREFENRRKTTVEIRKILSDIPVPKDIIVSSVNEINNNNFSQNNIFYIALNEGKVIYGKN